MKKAPKPKHYNAKAKQPAVDLSADDAVEKVWQEFWLPLYDSKEPSLDEIKSELAGYYFIMIHVSLVYEEITGGRMTNVKYEAKDVLANYAVHVEEMADEMKQTMYDDLKSSAVDGKIDLEELAKYLEVEKTEKIIGKVDEGIHELEIDNIVFLDHPYCIALKCDHHTTFVNPQYLALLSDIRVWGKYKIEFDKVLFLQGDNPMGEIFIKYTNDLIGVVMPMRPSDDSKSYYETK